MNDETPHRFSYPTFSLNEKGRVLVNGYIMPPLPTGPNAPPRGTPLITVRGRIGRLRYEVVFITDDNRRYTTTIPAGGRLRGRGWRRWKVSRFEVPRIEF